MRRLGAILAAACVVAAAALPAHADPVDEIAKRMFNLEGEALDLEKKVDAPAAAAGTGDAAQRHLVEAQVAYGVGNYADATILLFDIVEKYPQSRSYTEALFYLADSLFQKGDNLSARDFFHRVIEELGDRSPHYQKALERLIELSIRLQDSSRIQDYLARLDRLPQGTQLESVPYVRGKYAHFTGNYDEALRLFGTIPQTSKYSVQGRYFTGVTHVAKGELAEATDVLHALVKAKPKGATEDKVMELAHLALGRIHYERDEPADAIDHYLTIGRRSPHFDEALYEVAWVYVKAKAFDKALRALELLALANPKSAMLPDVRILEGNLRIRKAQAIAAASGNSSEEYAKANQVFEATRAAYEKPKRELDALMAKHADAKQFFAQLTGRAGATLDVQVEIPELALEWVKQEKEVARVLGITKNLDEIRQELDDTDKLLVRIQKAVESPSRVTIFPELAGRRSQAQSISDTLFSMRQQLATHERVLVSRAASTDEAAGLGVLQQRRHDLTAKLAHLPGSGDTLEERIRKAKQQYVEVDKRAAELETLIISIDAQIVAIDKYAHDMQEARKPLRGDVAGDVKELRAQSAELHKQLDAIRQEAAEGADEAGISDALAREEQAVRKELAEAVAAEHAAMQRLGAKLGADERKKLKQIALLMDKAAVVDATVGRANEKIDKILDTQLADVKATVVEEKAHLKQYQKTLEEYEVENVDVGAEVVAGSVEKVSKKFYEIAVRADVGVLDVGWAQKEQAQQALDRLRLDYAHEKNTLEAEFRDVREAEEGEAQPPQPQPQPAAPASQPATKPPGGNK